MVDPKIKIVSQWIEKAESDFATARILIFGEEKHLDTGVYHCQQTIEKSLKAFLTFHDATFSKTHDLENLVSCCLNFDSTLSEYVDQVPDITPYATEFRYPGDTIEPSTEDAESAYNTSKKILLHVKDHIR